MTEDRRYSSREVCAISEITYRQLDYWTATGVFSGVVEATPGSGIPRSYSADDVEQACAIRTLLDAGVSMQQIRRALDRGDVAGFLAQLEDAVARVRRTSALASA